MGHLFAFKPGLVNNLSVSPNLKKRLSNKLKNIKMVESNFNKLVASNFKKRVATKKTTVKKSKKKIKNVLINYVKLLKTRVSKKGVLLGSQPSLPKVQNFEYFSRL